LSQTAAFEGGAWQGPNFSVPAKPSRPKGAAREKNQGAGRREGGPRNLGREQKKKRSGGGRRKKWGRPHLGARPFKGRKISNRFGPSQRGVTRAGNTKEVGDSPPRSFAAAPVAENKASRPHAIFFSNTRRSEGPMVGCFGVNPWRHFHADRVAVRKGNWGPAIRTSASAISSLALFIYPQISDHPACIPKFFAPTIALRWQRGKTSSPRFPITSERGGPRRIPRTAKLEKTRVRGAVSEEAEARRGGRFGDF